MKTIEEAAKEYAIRIVDDTPINGFINDKTLKDFAKIDFKSGVEFAQRWIPIEEEIPKEGSKVLVKLYANDFVVCWFKNGKFKNTTQTPQKTNGNCDGNYFREDLTEYATHWRPIELK